MTTLNYIDKFERLNESEDYTLLRKRGVEYIEKMASRLWTDYNVHDPGITILEMLCYAISDLGYRIRYPVEDILAEETLPGRTDIRNFFTAREILPCNPVTPDDFRALMIDAPGVKNAWLEIPDYTRPLIYVNHAGSTLTLTPRFKVTDEVIAGPLSEKLPHALLASLVKIKDEEHPTEQAFISALAEAAEEELTRRRQDEIVMESAWQGPGEKVEPVHPRGLYDVILELETDPERGDLNRSMFSLDVQDQIKPLPIDVILPTWDFYFENSIDPAGLEGLAFHSLAYAPGGAVLEGAITLTFADRESVETGCRVISRGPKTAANRTRIENFLNNGATILKSYRARLERAIDIVKNVFHILHEHRGLCEDFCAFKAIAIDDVIICADLEIRAEADMEEVLAEIHYQVGRFLAPDVTFYTIREMMDRGLTADEIFEGPMLQHGFIDRAELAASEFARAIHASDIIRIIMDVEGVVAVKKIRLTNISDGIPRTPGEEWTLHIDEGRAARLDANRSKITFYKGEIPYIPDGEETAKILADKRALDRCNRLARRDYDLAVPKGSNRHIQKYHSIQNDFPLCYGVGLEGPPLSATQKRKAHAKQFKAYLLLYDQFLANGFAQLAHLKDLFSMNPAIKKTRFSQSLLTIPGVSDSDVPGIANLIEEFVQSLDPANHPEIDIDDPGTHQNQWSEMLEKFRTRLEENVDGREEALESRSVYEDRKNRALDHLMARFGEKFTDYVLLMYTIEGKKAPPELIADKLALLENYPVISHDRGKGFNYRKAEEPWFSENVGGLEKRASLLLGLKSYERRPLSTCVEPWFEIRREQNEEENDEFHFDLMDEDRNILFSSPGGFSIEEEARRAMRRVPWFGARKENYELIENGDGGFYFNLLDDQGQTIARRNDYFRTSQAGGLEIDRVLAFIEDHSECEGFHLVEHILLRPKAIEDCQGGDDCLLSVCVDKDCRVDPGWVDPYSFRVTIVAPYWPRRFRNMDFRRFIETTLRQEAPAHVHVKICWVNRTDMRNFEEIHHAWLIEMARETPEPEKLANCRKQLIAALASLRSIYPETALHRCVEGEDGAPILLNQSILGSVKPVEKEQ